MHGYSKKEARALRPNQILTQWSKVQQTSLEIKHSETTKTLQLSSDPLKFFEQVIGFKPFSYQAEFIKIFQENQFTAARWCRQSGKTFIIAALLLWYATTHPQSAIGIVGPSWRQTKRILSRIAFFTRNLPTGIAFKPQRTQIHFVNGSSIEAFPNNPETIRGPTLNVVYCLPAGVSVTLENGNQVPIEQLKQGQSVLSFNTKTGQIESKKVLRTFSYPLAGRRIIRLTHEFGTLECTADHRVYTSTRGLVASSDLLLDDKILYLVVTPKDEAGDRNKITAPHNIDRNPEAINLRWNVRRPLYSKAHKPQEKCTCRGKPFIKTSGLCAIQVFDSKEYSKKTARRDYQHWGLGKVPVKVLHSYPPRNHSNLSYLLSKGSQDCKSEVVRSNKQSFCVSNMVYGRWQYVKISGKHQHTQICYRRAIAPTAMAQKSMVCQRENRERQSRQRILPAPKSQRSRHFLQSHKAVYYTFDAIQDFAAIEIRPLLCLRQTRSSQKGRTNSQETHHLLKKRMQIRIKQVQPRMEAKKIKMLPCLWERVYPHSTKNLTVFKKMLQTLQTSVQKAKTVEKQETKKANSMFAMSQVFYSKKWSSKNLQCRMSETPKSVISAEVLPKEKSQMTFPNNQMKESNILDSIDCGKRKEALNFVYDIEVEDNHNFFADGVLVSNCDEFNFVANDQELYDGILYTLGSTDGKFVCSSTPWNTDSVFFRIFNHKDFSDFKTSHIPVEKALYPQGPLKPGIIQKIKIQMGDDPSRWSREMQAEWVEDDNVWLTQSLIASCVGTNKTCGEDLQEFKPDQNNSGEFFAGLDLAQTRDYCVLSVVERQNDKLYLRHLKIFQQPTLYATVLGYLKALQDRWGGFEKIRVDFTREGPSIIADMENAGINHGEGVCFSVPRKSEMAGLLKQRMMNKQFFYPLLSWERPYRGEICTELNVERYDLRKDGNVGFSHPMGTHDDVFWSLALAVYATANMEPEPFLAVIPR